MRSKPAHASPPPSSSPEPWRDEDDLPAAGDDTAEDEDADEDVPALPAGTQHPDAVPRARLDVWLWAARFFKTRGLAKAAIESGRVRVNGERAKVAKLLEPGMKVFAPQGWESIEMTVRQCADNRRGAPEARLLYQETSASIAERQRRADLRRAQPGFDVRPARDDRRRRAGFKRDGFLGAGEEPGQDGTRDS